MKTHSFGNVFLLGIALSLVLVALPLVIHAQSSEQTNLSATIKAALLADPRSAGMTQAQIDSLVAALSQKAATQGVTAQDITWRPMNTGETTLSPESTCWGYPAFFCELDAAYGFAGSDPLIPLALFIAAALFILVTGLMREHGHPHMDFPKRPEISA